MTFVLFYFSKNKKYIFRMNEFEYKITQLFFKFVSRLACLSKCSKHSNGALFKQDFLVATV